jgi:hypothetical protein
VESRNVTRGSAGWARARAPGSIGFQKEGEPMQTIRASLVALPFVGLAALVAALSLIIGPAQ